MGLIIREKIYIWIHTGPHDEVLSRRLIMRHHMVYTDRSW